jgi:hypothetical protein
MKPSCLRPIRMPRRRLRFAPRPGLLMRFFEFVSRWTAGVRA